MRYLYSIIPNWRPPQIDLSRRERLVASLEVLDKILLKRTYLVGHRLTLADITLTTVLQKLFATLLGAAERAKIPNVVRHFETVINQAVLKPVFGEPTLAEKALQYVAPPKPVKEKAPVAPAQPKEKAAPKPKPAPAAEEEDEDDEPSVPEEPKAKNPLDLLPKSTLNLEDWKRAYSNLDTRGPGGSLQWFYEKYVVGDCVGDRYLLSAVKV